jgi:hypothetical protein
MPIIEIDEFESVVCIKVTSKLLKGGEYKIVSNLPRRLQKELLLSVANSMEIEERIEFKTL